MIVSLVLWWYTTGWLEQAKRVGGRIDQVLESFSVSLLLRTLFSPFRQISAGQAQGPLGVQMRALGDRLFSRVFGAVVRSLFIGIGLLSALVAGMVGLVQLVVWPFVPLMPVIGLVAMVAGWTL